MNKIRLVLKVIFTYFFRAFPKLISDYDYTKILYYICFGKKINLKSPKTFNEKINYLKLFQNESEFYKFTDKYEVRSYVESKIGSEYLNEVLGVYNNADEIVFESLPQKFALKTTHGSGWNIIAHDKNALNIKKTKKLLNKWLKKNYYYYGREKNYKYINPRIVCEKFLETGKELLTECKVFCFNGTAKFVQVNFDSENGRKSNVYNESGELLNLKYGYPTYKNGKLPQNFEKIIEIAQKLAKDFLFVRVDLYTINDKIFFSELTFHPGGGFVKLEPFEYDVIFGDFLNIVPQKKILLLSQSQDYSFVDVVCRAAEKFNGFVTLLTGKKIPLSNENVEINYLKTYNPQTIITKFTTWILYLFDVIIWCRGKISSFDLIFATTNGPFVPIYAYLINKFKKIPYIVLVWDIYPDVIEKMFKNPILKPITFLWRALNKRVYKNASAVITIGDIMAQTVKKQVLDESLPVFVIPIYTDTDFVKPIKKEDNYFAKEHNLTDKFVLLFSGKIGLGHEISTILKIAQRLCDQKDIVFVIIGFGPGYDEISEFLSKNPMENLRLMPFLPLDVVPFSLTSADVGIVTLKKGMEGLLVPSRIYDLMSAGLAVLSISDGINDLKAVVEKFGIGFNSKTGDEDEFINNLMKLKNDQKLMQEIKKRSRDAALCYFSKGVTIDKYTEVFENVFQK